MIPQFQEQISWKLFGLHVALFILLAVHLNDHQESVFGEGAGFNDVEKQAIRHAQEILIDEGWLIVET